MPDTQPASRTPRISLPEPEAAKAIGISPRTLFSLRRAGRIGFVKLGSAQQARVLYPVAELERFISENLNREVATA